MVQYVPSPGDSTRRAIIASTSGSGAPAKISFKMFRTDSLETRPSSFCIGSPLLRICALSCVVFCTKRPFIDYSKPEAWKVSRAPRSTAATPRSCPPARFSVACFAHAALYDGLASSASVARRGLFHGGSDVTAHERPLQITQTAEFNVPHRFSFAFHHPIRIRQLCAARESQIHMPRAGRDIAEHILHLAAEAKPDRHRIHLVDRFRRIRRFFENYFPQSERQF